MDYPLNHVKGVFPQREKTINKVEGRSLNLLKWGRGGAGRSREAKKRRKRAL